MHVQEYSLGGGSLAAVANVLGMLAGTTGLEPATSRVTGMFKLYPVLILKALSWLLMAGFASCLAGLWPKCGPHDRML